MANCEKCGASVSDRDLFCASCGSRRTQSLNSQPRQSFCAGCGSPIPTGTRFCQKCGTPAAAQTGPFANTTIASPPTVTSPARATGFPKLIMVVLGMFATFLVLIMGTCGYVGYRAKKKADRIQEAYKQHNTARLAQELGVEQPAKSSTRASSPASPLHPASAVASPPPAAPAPPPAVPMPATGDQAHDWALEFERTENGPEADLVVRTGDINNLGFGWPQGFDPFSGESTPSHNWPDPNNIPPNAPDGTDRIMLGSAVIPAPGGDGYSGALGVCAEMREYGSNPDTVARLAPRCDHAKQITAATPIVLHMGALPPKIDSVLVQIFADDFQAPSQHSHFQVSLNGTRIPSFEYAINAIDQSGPIGKLLTFNLLPEYWPLLQSGTVKLLIDDPTTHQPDGYAVDFVRILVNPHNFKYQVSLAAVVTDADKHTPITGATVTAALQSAATDKTGKCQLTGLPAGLVVATAAAPGYDENSKPVDLKSGEAGNAEIQLHRHEEGTAALEQQIAKTGSAAVYGIHFDTDSAKLRADSTPALNAILGLMNNHPGSRWLIEGHTDNQGGATHNQPLSEARAGAVVSWLEAHGIEQSRLVPQGLGSTRPVADNNTANGRALNRRVEIAAAK